MAVTVQTSPSVQNVNPDRVKTQKGKRVERKEPVRRKSKR